MSTTHLTPALRPSTVPRRREKSRPTALTLFCSPPSSTASTVVDSSPAFTETMNSVLGSPFLTTPSSPSPSLSLPLSKPASVSDNRSSSTSSGSCMTSIGNCTPTNTQPTAQTTPEPISPVPTLDFSIISSPSTPTVSRKHPPRRYLRNAGAAQCKCASQDGFGYGLVTARNCDSLTPRSHSYHVADDYNSAGAGSALRTYLCPYCTRHSTPLNHLRSKSRVGISAKTRIHSKKPSIAKLWQSISSPSSKYSPSVSPSSLSPNGNDPITTPLKRKARSSPLRIYNGASHSCDETVCSSHSTSQSYQQNPSTSTLTFHTPRIYPKLHSFYSHSTSSKSKLHIHSRPNIRSRQAHTDTEIGTVFGLGLDYSTLSPLDGEEGELVVVDDRESQSDIDIGRYRDMGPGRSVNVGHYSEGRYLSRFRDAGVVKGVAGTSFQAHISNSSSGRARLFEAEIRSRSLDADGVGQLKTPGQIDLEQGPEDGFCHRHRSKDAAVSSLLTINRSISTVVNESTNSWRRTYTGEGGSGSNACDLNVADTDVGAGPDMKATAGWNAAVGYGPFLSWSSPSTWGPRSVRDSMRSDGCSRYDRCGADPDLDMDVASFISRGWRAKIVSGFDILTTLPPELSLHILSYLPLPDLLSCALVCKHWARLIEDNAVWWAVWRRAESGGEVEGQINSEREGDTTSGNLLRASHVSVGTETLNLDGEEPARGLAPWWCVNPRGWAVDLARASWCAKSGRSVLVPGWEERMREWREKDVRYGDIWEDGEDGLKHGYSHGRALRSLNPSLSDEGTSKFTLEPLNSSPVSSVVHVPHVREVPSSEIPTPYITQSPQIAPLMLDWKRVYKARALLERRWRDPEGEPKVRRIEGHTDSVYCLDFDSKRIITGSRDTTIKVWALNSGKLLGSFEGHRGSVLCLKFERDWDRHGVDSGRHERSSEQKGEEREADGGRVRGFMVSGSSDCTVCVWDLVSLPPRRTGRHQNSRKNRYREQDGTVGSSDESSDDNVGNGEHDRHNNEGSFIHRTHTGGGDDITDGEGEAGDEVGEVRATVRKVLRDHSGGVVDLRMDDQWVVSCAKDGLINVYCRRTLTRFRAIHGHEGSVNAVGLERGRVVSASRDGTMMLWDIESGERLRLFEGHERGMACIEFKDDLILSGSNDCTVKLWRASTGECLHTFVGHTLLVRALYFEPRSGYIVSASYDRSVRVWEWKEGEGGGNGTGRPVRVFKNLHASHIFDVRFDVGKIVSTSHDQRIVVLDFTYGIDGAELFV